MYGSPDWPLSSVNAPGEATLTSSVGVKLGSAFTSRGLLTFDAGVNSAGTGRVGSSPAGYDRGSVLRILEREEFEEATDPDMSLPPEELEKVDASESRERHDEPEEDDMVVLEVAVDMKDEATELRPATREHVRRHRIMDRSYVSPVSVKTSVGSFVAGVLPTVPRYVAWTPPECRGRPSWRGTQASGMRQTVPDMPVDPSQTEKQHRKIAETRKSKVNVVKEGDKE